MFYARKLIKVVFLAAFCIWGGSCTKTESGSDLPEIEFKSADSTTADSSYIREGGEIKFRVHASWGSALLTNFVITRTTETGSLEIANMGIYKYSFDTILTFRKSKSSFERWTFFIQDYNRNRAEISKTIFLLASPHYGGIDYYPYLTLYAQDLADSAHYLDAKAGICYATVTAADQPNIDLAYVFNSFSCNGIPTFSCPGDAAIALFYNGITSWAVKNQTYFDSRGTNVLTKSAYDSAINDSLILASYDSAYAMTKFEWLEPNMYIPFKNASGKTGIIQILSVGASSSGAVSFSLKIQK